MFTKIFVGFHVKYFLFFSYFKNTWIFWTEFRKIKFHKNPSGGSRFVPCGQDRQRNRRDETNSFRNYSNAPIESIVSQTPFVFQPLDNKRRT